MFDELLNKEPVLNVITSELFDERVKKVFQLLGDTLSKSFGPYGANTFISNYPHIHTTKDGYSIMKNLTFSTLLDRIISDLASGICNRLNATVGDGTTTSIVATNAIYAAYKKYESFFNDNKLLPRDILKEFDKVKQDVIDGIKNEAIKINTENPEELKEQIRRVVNISSNGDDIITNAIANLYYELKYPAIDVILSQTGETTYKIIEGYPIDVSLTDAIYINSDDKTLKANDVDVIMFSHKITVDTYKSILKPLNEQCRARKRKLLVIAPFFDDIAIQSHIQLDLNKEYRATKDINMILAVCTNTTAHAKLMMEDLCMLFNTTMITRTMENEIYERLSTGGQNIVQVFNIDSRDIPKILITDYDQEGKICLVYDDGNGNRMEDDAAKNAYIRLGYCGSISMGLKKSIFSGLRYNEELRQKHINDAKAKLEEAEEQYRHMGMFNIEIAQRQRRLYALNLKMGCIEVGGESEIMRGYTKDCVDDAVKAAASAYRNGIIKGCNVTTLQVISDLIKECDGTNNSIRSVILQILFDGFVAVYKTVLGNMFDDVKIDWETLEDEYDDSTDTIQDVYNRLSKCAKDMLNDAIGGISDDTLSDMLDKETPAAYVAFGQSETLHEVIINYSILTGKPFDLTTRKFSNEIVNSSETDSEVLKSISDLMSLLISGNQAVLANVNR